MTPLCRLLLNLVLCISSLVAGGSAWADASPPPNVVLIIGDDHGWPHSGFMGDPFVRTPNLDALAAQGTTFTNAHNPSSVCQPSLRALLAAVHTVQWERKTDALESILGQLPRRAEVAHFRTVARELGRQGYRSWEGGKFWEGTFTTAGFTHGLATSISTNYFTSVGDQFGREGWSTGTALAPLQAFLDEAEGGPFFLWVAPMLPHTPYDAPADFRAPYEQLGLSAAEVAYYANVSWLDALTGAVLDELQTRGLRDDTLIVYVSDNGHEIGSFAGQGHGKGTLYELGARTPVIFNWPGHVPSGAVRDDLVSTLDVPATLLDFAGADQLGDGDARSLKSALESGAPAGRDEIVSELPNALLGGSGFWVRTPQWRYVAALDGTEELYEIALDPYETLDVAALHPDLLQEFRADVAAWRAQIAAGEPLLDAAGRLTGPDGAPVAGETLQLRGRSSTGAEPAAARRHLGARRLPLRVGAARHLQALEPAYEPAPRADARHDPADAAARRSGHVHGSRHARAPAAAAGRQRHLAGHRADAGRGAGGRRDGDGARRRGQGRGRRPHRPRRALPRREPHRRRLPGRRRVARTARPDLRAPAARRRRADHARPHPARLTPLRTARARRAA